MRTKRILLLIALLLIAGAVGYAVTNRLAHMGTGPAPSVEEGGRARSFILRTPGGDEVSLEGYRGKAVVVVNFWATWCPPCRAEIPDFIDFYNGYKDRGVVVLAVNLREPEGHVRDFAQKAGMNFPVLLDLSGDVANIYKVQAIPTTVVVDKSGIIRSRIVGMTSREELERIVKPLL
ncbi:MAG: TlpA family protein disulfide reductase [Firmicutes bacterium]|nr:TlpA family protein disulfide reductase [Bacillota bacterium]